MKNNDEEKIIQRPKKRYGQHFLNDRSICRKIVSSIPDNVGKNIIEIGPGSGVLTNELLSNGYNVIAIEIDRDLIGPLEKRFKDQIGKSLLLINEDCINFIKRYKEKLPYIISNLPYNISTDLIVTLLDRIQLDSENDMISGGTIMFQKEFGERITAEHGNKKYGRISIYFQMKMEFNRLFDVPRDVFYPIPKVDSIVINFKQKQENVVHPINEELFKRIVDISFMNRRKMLKNTLSPGSLGIEMTDMEFQNLLKEHQWYDCRPEDFSPKDFADMADLICYYK
jgi:16S rRNA (adenine1518-N6/adenine1519-N6)-dimethyltransferase